MFFFRVSISSFDDETQVMFLVPDQSDADELGVPFQEKLLTNSPLYKEFVKKTKTTVVDVAYTLYKAEFIPPELTEEAFGELMAQQGALEAVDENEISITTGKSKSGGGKSKNAPLFIVAAVAAVVVIGLIAAAAGGGKSEPDAPTAETVETAAGEATTESAEPVQTETETADTAAALETLQTADVYIDRPAETESAETAQNETATAEASAESVPQGSQGGSDGAAEYVITFSANGGAGTLDSITAAPGQYVTLPSAAEAAKSLSREGYDLIGFSDSKAINYPLYDYRMPYQNVTLYAVWEAAAYTVTYNSNGGVGTLSRAECRYGADVPMPADAAIYKDELVLAGWNTSPTAKSALKSLKMPAENLTLYAVWSSKKPTAKITLHYDDNVIVMEKEIGSHVDMLDDFGAQKEGMVVSGWYLEGSQQRIENLYVSGSCDVYAKWERAEYITVSIDRSYLNRSAEKHRIAVGMKGARLTLPVVNDPNDPYQSVYGCTYGYSTKPQKGQYAAIKYYGGTEYCFTEDVTLYRVLGRYGGGKGTAAEPYLISSCDQLLFLAENGAAGYFKQTADITFPADAERRPISTPVIYAGYEDKYYDLFVYDGQGYTINGLRGEGGLFGTLAAATIRNVRIKDAKITTGGADCGILVNSVTSYFFDNEQGSGKFSTGNTRVIGCTVSGSITADKPTDSVGGLVGAGGVIEECMANSVRISGSAEAAGGIVGTACTVTGCIANSINVEAGIASAGGIAGTAYGAEICSGGSKPDRTGGSIIGCGVRTFTSKAANSGGIIGTGTAIGSAYIKSCYAANLFLNGTNNGGIVGVDGSMDYSHAISCCIVDSSNGYSFVGSGTRSRIGSRVLSVPADSGLTVDGVLSVLNASGSGYSLWQRKPNVNNGYPYPLGINF